MRYSLNGRLIEEVFFKEGVNFQRAYLSYIQGQGKWHHVIYDEKWGMYVFEGQMEEGENGPYFDGQTSGISSRNFL